MRFDEEPYLIGNAELWTVESRSLMGPQYNQALTRLRKLNRAIRIDGKRKICVSTILGEITMRKVLAGMIFMALAGTLSIAAPRQDRDDHHDNGKRVAQTCGEGERRGRA